MTEIPIPPPPKKKCSLAHPKNVVASSNCNRWGGGESCSRRDIHRSGKKIQTPNQQQPPPSSLPSQRDLLSADAGKMKNFHPALLLTLLLFFFAHLFGDFFFFFFLESERGSLGKRGVCTHTTCKKKLLLHPDSRWSTTIVEVQRKSGRSRHQMKKKNLPSPPLLSPPIVPRPDADLCAIPPPLPPPCTPTGKRSAVSGRFQVFFASRIALLFILIPNQFLCQLQ